MEHHKIYQNFKERIIWLDLPPETALNVSELAEAIGVSRTPVKEALILLQSEGWVLRQGSLFLVTPLSLDRIREITDIRLVMEVQANVWAAARIRGEELAVLGKLIAKARTLDRGQPNREMVELDFQFHRTVFRSTGNVQLTTLLERYLGHYLRFWLSIPREIEPQTFFAEIFDLFDALQDKDEERIRRISHRHIVTSVEEIMDSFLKFPADPLKAVPDYLYSGRP